MKLFEIENKKVSIILKILVCICLLYIYIYLHINIQYEVFITFSLRNFRITKR